MPDGNRTVLVDGVGNRTTWTYDLLNRVVAEQDVGGTATFAYDGAGQLASTTDKLGRRRDFDYDLAGRKESEVWFTSGATVQLQTWTYDLAGRMTTARDPDGTYTYTYDDADRVARADGPFGAWFTYAYDKAGNRTGVTDSTGVVTTVAFDAKNRQSSEAAAGGGSSATRFDYSYTDRGQVSAVKRYSDLAGTATVALSAYSYDDAMRLTALTHTSGAGVTLAHFTYAYDAADRLTGKTDNGTYTSYAYDDARQLTRDGAATFGYDAAGNRTNAGYATGAGNRISTDGVWTYTHDAEGNVTKRSKGASSDTWVYAYDHKNQLLTAAFSLTDGGAATQRVTYAYDASGSRVQRQGWDGATTTTERYALDGGDPAKPRALGNEYKDAVLVLDGSNAVVTRWAFGTGFAEVVAGQSAAGAVTWDLADRQGSVRAWINNSATTLATASFDGYGKLLTGGTIYDGIGYAGQRRDPITLLYSNGNGTRELLVDSGVWMQSDPRWPLTGEANPFMYVRNSPTNATDPSGMELYVVGEEAKEAVLELLKNDLWMKGPGSDPVAVRVTEQGALPEDPSEITYRIDLGINFLSALRPDDPFPGMREGPAKDRLGAWAAQAKQAHDSPHWLVKEMFWAIESDKFDVTVHSWRAPGYDVYHNLGGGRGLYAVKETVWTGIQFKDAPPRRPRPPTLEEQLLAGNGLPALTKLVGTVGVIDPTPVTAIVEATLEAYQGNRAEAKQTLLLGLIPFLGKVRYLKPLLKAERAADAARVGDTASAGGHIHFNTEPGLGLPPAKPAVVAPTQPGGVVPNGIPKPGTPEWTKPWSEEWVRPVGQKPQIHLPSAKYGTWSGAEGHSYFIPRDPAFFGLKPDEVVPFRQGYADFSKWARDGKTYTTKEKLNGFDDHDRPIFERTLQAEFNAAAFEGRTNWTREQVRDKLKKWEVTPHHSGGEYGFQLIDWKLHGNRRAVPPIKGISHAGGAGSLRSESK